MELQIENIDQQRLLSHMVSTGCGSSVGDTLLWYMAKNTSKYSYFLNNHNKSLDLAEMLWGVGYMGSEGTGTLAN